MNLVYIFLILVNPVYLLVIIVSVNCFPVIGYFISDVIWSSFVSLLYVED